jgi:DNA repair protein RadD
MQARSEAMETALGTQGTLFAPQSTQKPDEGLKTATRGVLEARPYQALAVEMVRNSYKSGHKAPLLCLSTGLGKTIFSVMIIKLMVEQGKRLIFIAHRRSLVLQTAEVFRRNGIDADVIMAGHPFEDRHPVTVCSVDTLLSRHSKNLSIGVCLERADLICWDECHVYTGIARAEFYAGLLARGKLMLGMTATPCRPDGSGLGTMFDDLIIPITMREGIEAGYLLQPRYFSGARADLSKVRSKEDYNQGDLGKVYGEKTLIGKVYENWKLHAEGTSTVIFTPTCDTAAMLCDEFNSHGVKTEYVDAKTASDDRQRIFKRVQSGETTVLCNVGIVSVGVDIPAIQTVVFATATKSIVKVMQGVGRGMRPHGDQKWMNVLDHGGWCLNPRIGFVEDITDWSLEAKNTVNDRVEKKKKKTETRMEFECPKCHRVYQAAASCPGCGFVPEKKKKPLETTDDELGEIITNKAAAKRNRNTSAEEKEYFFGEMKSYGRAHNYKPGWAMMKFRDKFGVFPNDFHGTPERVPRESTMVWIQNQNRAYFIKNSKAKRKEV